MQFIIQPAVTQIYSPVDSLALITVDVNCDLSDNLNWNSEPDPANWTGVFWDDQVPKRVWLLEIYGKELTGIPDYNSLEYLESLFIGNNPIEDIKIHDLTNLKQLDISYSAIDSLDLRPIINLQYVNLLNNPLVHLRVDGLPALKDLACAYNQLDTLILKDLPSLTDLNISENPLFDIDLSDLEQLEQLACYNTELVVLPVSNSKNPNITFINCMGNHIDTLHLDLENLENLMCSDNNMLHLDFIHFPAKLMELESHHNRLSSIDMAGAGHLIFADLANNKLPFSSLKTALHAPDFLFLRQDTIFEKQTYSGNTLINYTAEARVNSEVTEFTFYQNDSLVETNTHGLYLTNGNGRYFCKMTNPAFPDLTLVTAAITITDVPSPGSWNIMLYPNPAFDYVYCNRPDDIYSVTFYDLAGRRIAYIAESFGEMDVSYLLSGLYIVRVESSKGNFTQKIIKREPQ